MGKTIPELKEELARKQSAALTSIFDAQAESARLSLDFIDDRVAATLGKEDMNRLWTRERQNWIAKARDEAKAAYLAAEEEYAEKQAERVQEIHETVFGATREASVGELQKLAEATEETLDGMLTLALQGDNEPAARLVLHAAWSRSGAERLLERWRQEVKNGEEDLDLLSELQEALSDEQVEARLAEGAFDRVAPDEPTWESLQPQQGARILGA